MPSFKQSIDTKLSLSSSFVSKAITLDKKHRQFLHEFSIDETNYIPRLRQQQRSLAKRLQKIEKTIEILSSNDEKLHTLKQTKIDLERDIELNKLDVVSLKQKKNKYFLDNAPYIFDYFENKKSIDTYTEKTELHPRDATKNALLKSFFNIKKAISSSASSTIHESKNSNLLHRYLENIDNDYLDINMYSKSAQLCSNCKQGEFIIMEDEGVYICNQCSNISQYLIESEKHSYKEPPKEVSFYAYRKINHFKEILAQFQGKETTQIPLNVLDNLKMQIVKERIQVKTLTYNDIKLLLKKLGYNKYYEHINFIKNKMGIKTMVIPQELEETLCNFFTEIQYPYAKHCPDYRINFLHYYYVLYKLFELLGETQYLAEIPMLKDKDKLMEQDNIWKKICEELNWQFITTL